MNLYRATNKDTSENQVEWVDKKGKIYDSIFTFREDVPIEKKIRIICKEQEFNRYELLTFEEGYRLIEHSCKEENKKLKYRTLIEINRQGDPNTERKRLKNVQI